MHAHNLAMARPCTHSAYDGIVTRCGRGHAAGRKAHAVEKRSDIDGRRVAVVRSTGLADARSRGDA